MDAILSRSRFWHRSKGHALVAFAPAIAAILTTLLLLAAVLLISRRLSGALIHPLPTPAMLGVGVFIASVAFGARSLLHIHGPGRFAFQGLLANICRWSPSVALPIIALSISLPGSSVLGLIGLWLIVLGEEAWHGKNYLRRTGYIREQGNLSSGNATSTPPEIAMLDEPIVEADWQSTSLTQRLTYERTESGALTVEGWLRAEFQPEQRIAAVHVAFCPPLAGSPQVDAEPLDGPDCTVRPTLVLPWGVRWEIKLDVPATQPEHVILGFHATDAAEQEQCRSHASAPES